MAETKQIKHESLAQALAAARSIARFPDYRFCEDGRAISLTRKEPFFMRPIKMGKYVGLQLRRSDGSRERAYLHRLIAEAWHGPAPAGAQCRHLDGRPNNNSALNLAWGTPAENNADKKKHGTVLAGSRNSMAVLDERVVQAMRAWRSITGESFAKIAMRTGCSPMTAYRAIVGKAWEHV